jgi:uncharacterized protein YodC (DUF2158 family)
MSQENQFAVGETVSLNSGGRLMTVLSIDGETITCVWSVREDIKTKSFPAPVLKKAEEPRTVEQMLKALWAEHKKREEQAANNPSVKAAKQAYEAAEQAYNEACAKAYGGELPSAAANTSPATDSQP